MNKLHILIVNINNLEYTKNCISDLILQTSDFDLTIFDQNSTEMEFPIIMII
jgi:GT2 family glycosyltransferase